MVVAAGVDGEYPTSGGHVVVRVVTGRGSSVKYVTYVRGTDAITLKTATEFKPYDQVHDCRVAVCV